MILPGTKLEHLNQLMIHPGMSNQTSKVAAAFRAVLTRGITAMAWKTGDTLFLLRMGEKGRIQRVYNGKSAVSRVR